MNKKACKAEGNKPGVYGIVFIIAFITLVLCRGGFFEIGIAAAGLFAAAVWLSRGFKANITLPQGIFFVFALWYMLCTFQNGFIIEYAVRGAIPLVVFMFWVYISHLGEGREKVIDIITEISLFIALAAVVHSVVISIEAGAWQRLTFPFDYSNASGIYFAVCFFYARRSKTLFVKRCRFIFPVALILSGSVGSAVIFAAALLYSLATEKKYKHIVCTLAAIAIFALLFRARILQSGATFAERLLQIYDGIMCMLANPVAGIGAGWWENAKNYYQSGFYITDVLHSSITAVGVSSGFVGLALLLAVCAVELYRLIKNKGYALPAIMLLVHSFVDFSLSFTSLCILLLLSADYSEQKAIAVKPVCKNIVAFAVAAAMLFSAAVLMKSAVYQNKIAYGAQGEQVAAEYKSSRLLQTSVNAGKCCAAALYDNGKGETDVSFEKYKYMPDEMTVYMSMKGGSEEYLLHCLKKQPYNTFLRDHIAEKFPGPAGDKAKDIVDRATDNTSFLGKILYELKGENL